MCFFMSTEMIGRKKYDNVGSYITKFVTISNIKTLGNSSIN